PPPPIPPRPEPPPPIPPRPEPPPPIPPRPTKAEKPDPEEQDPDREEEEEETPCEATQTFDGGTGENALQAGDCANVWTITGFNSGTLTSGAGIKTFSGIGTLIGGASSDIFIFSLGGSLSGSIDGGGIALLNSLEAGPGNNDWTIAGSNAGTVTNLASGFKNIATVRGGLGADTFTLEAGGSLDGSIEGGGLANLNTIKGSNQSLDWTIAGANTGSVTGVSLGFTNIGNLVGSSSSDTFTLTVAGSLAGSIDGNGGNNTLQGVSVENTWTITSNDTGSIDNIAGTLEFSDIANLIGGNADDTFILENNSQITGEIVGGGGNNTLQGGSVENTWTITSNDTGSIDNIAGTTEFSDIANLIGGDGDDTFILEGDSQITGEIAGGGGNNTLQGGNVDNEWTIVTDNMGDLTNIGSGEITSFREIANLIGGNQADTFTLSEDSHITGTIDGGNGKNTLEGGDSYNTWTITDENAGNISNSDGTTNFTEITNLIGGDDDDIFILENNSQITGEIAGKEGDNTLKGGNVRNTWTITAENAGYIENRGDNTNFTQITNLIGGNDDDTFILEGDNRITGEISGGGGNDTLEGGNVSNTWRITDNNAGVVENSTGRTEFNQIAYLTGNDQADIFILEDNSHITGAIAGGGGTNTLQGDNVRNTWTITAENAGNITNRDGTTNFTQIANLIGGNDDDTFILQGDNHITGEIAGRTGENTLQGGDVENNWTISDENAGEIDNQGGRTNFTEISNLIGGNDDDTFILRADNRITGEIAGRAGDNTLEGGNAENTWTITDENAGNITNNSGSTAFTEIANLTGGNDNDIFILDEDGYITGAIAGGEGDNTLQGGNVENNWTINAENAGTVDNGNDTTAFREINKLIGGNDEDTFVFEDNGLSNFDFTVDGGQGDPQLNTLEINADTDLNWLINRQNGGEVSGEDLLLEFDNIANLTGSAGNDEFKLEDATVAEGGTIDGRAGVNSLSGGITDTTNTWVVNGVNSGNFTATKDGTTYTFDFTNIQNLNGSDADDVFKLQGGVLYGSGAINGGGGKDTIEQQGSADDDDDDFTTTWTLTDEDSGTISDSTPETFTVNGQTVTTNLVLRNGFTNIENLVGGADEDVFIVNDGVTFTGNIDAGDGGDTVIVNGTGTITGSVSGGENTNGTVDVIDLSGIADPVVFNLQDINFSEFEVVIGNNQNSTIIGSDQPNTWEITGENEVVIENITFIGFNNLVGGAGVDTFNFTAADAVVHIDEEVPPDATGEVFSLALITGNLLARLLARNPEDTVTISDVDGTIVTGDESTVIAGNYGRLNINEDGTYSYAVELSDPAVVNLPVGASLTDTFSYTIEQGTNSITTELIVTIQNTADGLIMTDNVNSIDITGSISAGGGDDIFNFANDALISAVINSDAGGDNFNFADTAQVVGTVDGGDNLADTSDVVDFSQASGTVVINLGDNNFNNIETFIGNGIGTTLIASDTNNTWTINVSNGFALEDLGIFGVSNTLNQGGSNTNIEFNYIGNLTGGSGNDTFKIKSTTLTVNGKEQVDWGVIGKIDGGQGNNAILMDGINTVGITWEIDGGNAGKAYDQLSLVGGFNSLGQPVPPARFSFDRITFQQPHNLLDGQTVLYAHEYYLPPDISTPEDINYDLSGLKRGELYTVRRINESTISLVDNQGKTVTGLSFPSIPGTSITGTHWLTKQVRLNFQNIGDITGDGNNDTFFLRPHGSLSGTIDGGGGNNSLQGSDTANIWSIEGFNAGKIFPSTGLTFDGSSSSVVNTGNNITFSYRHNLVTGDRVQYRNGTNQANGDIGGLVSGDFYQVIRQDDFTVKLTNLSNSNFPISLSPTIDGGNNHELIKTNTFIGSEGVERNPLLNLGQYDYVAYDSSRVDTTNKTITFSSAHNFVTGDLVQYQYAYQAGETETLVNREYYRVIRQDNLTIQLTQTGSNIPIDLQSAIPLNGPQFLVKANDVNRIRSSAENIPGLNVSEFTGEFIEFARPHNLSNGQAVAFRALSDDRSSLNDWNLEKYEEGVGDSIIYYAIKIDDYRIALANSFSNAIGRIPIFLGFDGSMEGQLTPVSNFQRIESLFGGASSDFFSIKNGRIGGFDTNSGGIFGRGGINTLKQSPSDIWNLRGIDRGETNFVFQFSQISNLIGSNVNDTFIVNKNARLTGSIDGDSGDNTLQSNSANFVNWTISGQNAGLLQGEQEEQGLSFNRLGGGTILTSDFRRNHNLVTGQAFSNYFVIKLNNQEIQLAATLEDAFAGQAISLTSDRYSGIPKTAISFNNITRLEGSDNADTFTIADERVVSSINGKGGNNTLQALNVLNQWLVTGTDAGSLSFSPIEGNNATINFTNVGNLQGGTERDRFTLAGGTLSGTVNGEGGDDTLAIDSNITTTWTVTGADAGTVTGITGGFSNIANLKGGNRENTFILDNNGSLSGNIDGGLGADTFIIGGGGSLSGFNSIDGGGFADINTIQIANTNGRPYTWEITGADRGNLQGAINLFSNIGKLVGGSGGNTFIFQPGGSLSPGGIIDGGRVSSPLNTLQINSTLALNWSINSQDTGLVQGQNFLLSFSNIANLKGGFNTDTFLMNNAAVSPGGTIDGGTGVNLLLGGFSGITNTWIVNGINSGIFVAPQTTFNFSNIQNLNGSNADDVFKLRGGVLFGSGSIDGGGGDDTIEQEENVTTTWTLTGDGAGKVSDATPETFTVNGVTVTTSEILKDGFRNIENLIGGAEADIFIVNDGVTFTGGVDGGGGSDRFNFNGTSQITGNIGGGNDDVGGVDLLDFSGFTGTVTIDLNNPALTGIETIIGNGANTTIIGKNTANTWTVNDANGTVNGLTFTNVHNLRGGSDIDTFNIQSATNAITIDAGAGDDQIKIGNLTPNLGGTVNNITGALTITGGEGNDQLTIDDSGDTAASTGTLTATTITGLSPSSITYGTVETLNVNLGSGANNFTVQGTTAVTTIIGGSGDDIIDASASSQAITIFGNAGNDRITGGAGNDRLDTGTGQDFVIGGAGNDFITVQGTSGGGTTVLGGLGDDRIEIGTPLADAGRVGRTLNNLLAGLTINGEAGVDTLGVYDDFDTIANTGSITFNNILGLGMAASGLFYIGIENLTVELGDGANSFTVQNTNPNATTTITGGSGVDTINVQTINSVTTINGDAGNDVINVVSPGAPTVNTIAAGLTINGGADTDTITINDSGDTAANTGTLTSTTITGLSPATITYGTAETLNINLGAGADTFTISSTSATTTINAGVGNDTLNVLAIANATTLNAGIGNDVINVGSATTPTVNGITAALTINGGAETDTVNINDSGDTAANTGTLTSSTITGLSSGSITYGTVETLNINLGAGADTFTVSSTSVTTTINANGGADTLNVEAISNAITLNAGAGNDVINVGSATTPTVNGIAAALTINGGTETDTVNINDNGDTAANTGTLTSSTITGLSPSTITYGTVETLNINLGAGADSFTVSSSSATTTINAGGGADTLNVLAIANATTLNADAGNDVINVGTAGTLAANGIAAALTINGGSETDTITINDSGDTAANTGTLTSTTITGLSSGTITYGTAETLNINLGTGADTLTVSSTGAATTINANGGNDTLNVQAIANATTLNADAGDDVINVGGGTPNTVNAIAAALTINGGADTDTITINDSGDTANNTGTLTATALTGLGSNGITYGTVETLNINLGSGSNNLTVQGVSAATTITGGSGNDTINASAINQAIAIYGNAGNDNITGGGGNDTLDSGTGEDTVTAGGGNDLIYVQGTSGAGTTINGDAGNDVINIGSSTSNTVNTIAAALTINGGNGIDTVNINDSGDTAANTGTLTSTAITGLSPATITYGTVETLNINLGAGADTLTVSSTSATTTVNAGGGNDTLNVLAIANATTLNADAGNDVINVGSAEATILNVIASDLTINGGDNADTININNSANTANNSGGLSSTTIDGLGLRRPINYSTVETLNINLGTGADRFTISSTGAVTTINTGGGNDTVNVEAISHATTLNTGAGNDEINVGNRGLRTVNDIAAALTINGGADTDTVRINDTDDNTNNTGTLTATTITGLSPTTITYGTVETLNIELGRGADTFTVSSTSATTTINAGDGADTLNVQAITNATTLNAGTGNNVINVASAGTPTVNGIAAALTINGGPENNSLEVRDSGDTTANTGTLTDTQLTGLGMTGGITYREITNLSIRLGSGNNNFTIASTFPRTTTSIYGNVGAETFNVRSIRSSTNIFAAGGNDTINVSTSAPNGGGIVNEILALLFVDGGAGGDTLNVDDRGDGAPNNGTMTANTITGLGMSNGISYTLLEATNILLGSGNDIFTINSKIPGSSILVDGGPGIDLIFDFTFSAIVRNA
ncbi:hypothetical protein GNE54_00490, partial [Trichormus variabilis V5]|nr:hypothetical protein [Trichormus variabilis V5]